MTVMARLLSRGVTAKYGAVVNVAIRHTISHRGDLVGRAAFTVVILLVFARLWEVVRVQGAALPYAAEEMVWYLAVTEWVLLSIPTLYLDIESDIRSGEIAYRLPRPISYLGSRLAEGLGAMLVRMGVLGLTGFCAAFVLTGRLPVDRAGLWWVVPLGLGAATVGMICYACIGLGAIWLQDVSPVYWIWQKLMFVFGGLLLPLDIYPQWLRTVAEWTPFHALLYGVGRWVFGFEGELLAPSVGRLLLWGVIAALIAVWIHRRGLRCLDVNGG